LRFEPMALKGGGRSSGNGYVDEVVLLADALNLLSTKSL
jgi:hypothetical protein